MFSRMLPANESLFICGIVHFGLFVLFLILSLFDHRQVMGINLWIKPMKFAISICIYLLTWPFLLQYLPFERARTLFSSFTVAALSFEMLCIASQAARGEMSHFNTKGTYNFIVFAAMGVTIVLQTLFAGYIGVLFFRVTPGQVDPALLWGIRLGILISCAFAFQGGLMASRLSHTVGAPDGGRGLPFVNWSRTAGDLRIAHFAGLHALQVIPFFGRWMSHGKTAATLVFAAMYTLLAGALLARALSGRAVFNH